MSSPLRLTHSPHSSHFHPLAQIWSHLPHNRINILALLDAEISPFFCTFLLFPLDNEMLMLFGHERHAVDTG